MSALKTLFCLYYSLCNPMSVCKRRDMTFKNTSNNNNQMEVRGRHAKLSPYQMFESARFLQAYK